MKKLISLLLAASISFCLAACGNSASLPNNSEAGPGNDSQGDVKRITIGTAGTSGALYPMGVAMAETITNHVNGITATGESTAASIENLRNLHDGKMAIVTFKKHGILGNRMRCLICRRCGAVLFQWVAEPHRFPPIR